MLHLRGYEFYCVSLLGFSFSIQFRFSFSVSLAFAMLVLPLNGMAALFLVARLPSILYTDFVSHTLGTT